MSARAWLAVATALAVATGRADGAEQGNGGAGLGSCHRCHLGLGGDLGRPAERFEGDVHAQPGLGCTACHGGDASADDPAVAMSPAKGFTGVPARREVPRLCGTCHADAELIKRYEPNLPTDQLSQYRTSAHARELAKGNERAAVCTSCHGAHGILPADDSRSPVHPSRVVETCASCHAAADGSGPVARYRRSVHAAALASGDLSAPGCPRCHGAHGATPPGVQSVANVCGQCHPQNMELYRASPHQAAFAALDRGGCEACHGHHEVLHPTDDWVGVSPGAICSECHEPGEPGGRAAADMHAALRAAAALVQEAERRTEAARSRGMLMVDAQVAIEDARQELIHARTLVHAADAERVQARTAAASATARRALDQATRAFSELRQRRAGMLVALALIVVAIVALALKLRELDSARR